MVDEKLLELRGVSKRFGATLALNHVDFDLRPGEVHGLVGENGAGKSTLMKILSGYHTDYEGEIAIRDKNVQFKSTRDALGQGIGMIYQELSVVKTLSVGENLFLGDPPRTKLGVVDWKRIYRDAGAQLKELGLDVNVRSELGQYTIATRQLIEVASVIFSGAEIIIMDEPTSALSHSEVQRLFGFIRKLKSMKKGIVFISHFLDDVLEISDRITVLRNGEKVMTVDAADTDKSKLTKAILGREELVSIKDRRPKPFDAQGNGQVVLELKNLHRGKFLHGVNLKVRKGEILGIYGGMGAGKAQLAGCVFGTEKPDSGEILLDGKPVHFRNTVQARKAGIAYVPANRNEALFLRNEIFKNITISHLDKICPGLVSRKAEMAIATEKVKILGVRPKDPNHVVQRLSGGNQQKVVFGKWLAKTPKVLLLNDPTRGMDVGAKEEVMSIVESLREQGVATILFSTEPELVMKHADRVIILRRGAEVAELKNEELSKELLLQYT